MTDTVNRVSSHFSFALEKLADATSELLYPTNPKLQSKPANTDNHDDAKSKMRGQRDTCTVEMLNDDLPKLDTSDISGESSPMKRKEEEIISPTSHDQSLGETIAHTLSDHSSFGPPPPPHLLDSVAASRQPPFSDSIRRPIPKNAKSDTELLPPRPSTDAKNRKLPSSNPKKTAVVEAYAKASPLARMRSDRMQDAVSMSPKAIADTEAVAKMATAALKSNEEIMIEKHKKWKRNLKRAQRKQKELLEMDYEGKSTFAPNNVVCGLRFEKLFFKKCGEIEDVVLGEDVYMKEAQYDSDYSSEYSGSGGGSAYESVDSITDYSHSEVSVHLPAKSESRQNARAGKGRAKTAPRDRRLVKAESMRGGSNIRAGRIVTQEKSKVDLNDKNFIKAFIEEMCQEGVPLIWHEKQKVQTSARPPNCKLYLKLGCADPNGVFDAPQLTWGTESDSRTTATEGKVDLFEIQCLEKASRTQIQMYPFAVPGSSLFMRLNDGTEFLFEGQSDKESHRIIHGLKWLIARLAFNIVIGNKEVSCELLDLSTGNRRQNNPLTHGDEKLNSSAIDDVSNQLVDNFLAYLPK